MAFRDRVREGSRRDHGWSGRDRDDDRPYDHDRDFDRNYDRGYYDRGYYNQGRDFDRSRDFDRYDRDRYDRERYYRGGSDFERDRWRDEGTFDSEGGGYERHTTGRFSGGSLGRGEYDRMDFGYERERDRDLNRDRWRARNDEWDRYRNRW